MCEGELNHSPFAGGDSGVYPGSCADKINHGSAVGK